MKSLFGWGGVKIADVEFTNAFGTLSFERVDVRNTTIAGTILLHAKGWRPIIEIEVFNLDCGSVDYAQKFRQLAQYIALSQYEKTPLNVYPRFGTDAGSQLYYSCYIDSDFAPEDVANTEAGQSLRLKFIGVDLVTSLPSNLSNPTMIVRTTDSGDDTAIRTYDDNDNTKIRVSEEGS